MATLQVKKIVAVCFLEAVRMTLDHIGKHRMEMANDDLGVAEDLPKLYGEVRRLRDYIQRGANAFPDDVEFDLEDEDRALLVACCRRFVEAVDVRLAGPEVTDASERQLLLKKQQLVADWAVELAQKPLLQLSIPRMIESPGAGSRALKLRMQKKLYGIGEQKLIRQGDLQPVSSAPENAPGSASGAGAATGTVPVIELVDRDDPENPPAARSRPLLDTMSLADPRLRALAAMDLRSLDLAERSRDHRIATVLLASILEAAVVDHAIQRREQLGLTGTPDTWNVQELLLDLLGETATPNERAFAVSLFASRNLVSPARQMITPLVVTGASVASHREFVASVLHQLGFAGRAVRVG